MTWIISQALCESLPCLQEQVAEYSAVSCSDGKQSVQSSGSRTPLLYCAPDKMTAFSRLSRSGMTFKHSTACLGGDWLTSYLAAFPARTYQAQEKEKESPEQGQECGSTWRASFAKYDPDTHSLKTAQCSFIEDSTLSSPTLPRWGTMRNGVVYQQPTVALRTNGIESGLLLPTPTKHNAKEGAYPSEYERNTPTLATHAGGQINPEWTEHLMSWPIGWTDCLQSGTVRYHEWLLEHSKS